MSNNVFTDWLETYFDEVTPYEFYRGIFPQGELQEKGKYDKGKYNAIAVEVTTETKRNGKPKIKRYTITDDLETIGELCQQDNFCLCSPITYCGKERTSDNARFLYAIAVDLDRIQKRDGEPTGLMSLWNGHIQNVGRIPKPTYIVSSGTGLHLYYVFDNAIPLFRDTAKQLQALKRELTNIIWHGTVVDIENEKEIQQEGIYQGFRIPGTITKTGDRARAFITGEKVTIEYLNEFVTTKNKVTRYTEKKELTLSKAKQLYPEWYEKRIVNKEPKGVWHVSRNVYDWWKREILQKTKVGHRYYCLMILAMYARKCSMYDEVHNPNPVTYDELESDCWEIARHFETLTDDGKNHFTKADVLDALESFNDKYITYPRNSIEFKCGFTVPQNKRNRQRQVWHLEDMRSKKANMKRRGQAFKNPEGRPKGTNKQYIVKQWQANNPGKRKTDCIKETGLSKPTVYKYWE